MIKIAKAASTSVGQAKKVALTRFLPRAIEALTKNGCDVYYYDSETEKIPYTELEKLVLTGVDGIFCLLTDSIDENIKKKELKNLEQLYVSFESSAVKTAY